MDRGDNSFRVKVGLAEMLKGGVILDVTTAEQAKIAEDAGAAAVMALERVPADIRVEGGVARMAAIEKIAEIQNCVSIPVMAKIRIGHIAEARMLEALEVDFIDESEIRDDPDEMVRGTVEETRHSPTEGPLLSDCGSSSENTRAICSDDRVRYSKDVARWSKVQPICCRPFRLAVPQ